MLPPLAMTACHRCLHWIVVLVGFGIVAASAACGRIGFDPPRSSSGESDAANGDAGGPGDAALASCAGAIAVPFNTRVAANTCVGVDRIAGCGPAGTREVIFKFVPPTSGSYVVGAYDPGTANISNSTSKLDSTCSTRGQCAGLTGTSFTAGVAVYFVVEAASGGCAAIEFWVH